MRSIHRTKSLIEIYRDKGLKERKNRTSLQGRVSSSSCDHVAIVSCGARQLSIDVINLSDFSFLFFSNKREFWPDFFITSDARGSLASAASIGSVKRVRGRRLWGGGKNGFIKFWGLGRFYTYGPARSQFSAATIQRDDASRIPLAPHKRVFAITTARWMIDIHERRDDSTKRIATRRLNGT